MLSGSPDLGLGGGISTDCFGVDNRDTVCGELWFCRGAVITLKQLVEVAYTLPVVFQTAKKTEGDHRQGQKN